MLQKGQAACFTTFVVSDSKCGMKNEDIFYKYFLLMWTIRNTLERLLIVDFGVSPQVAVGSLSNSRWFSVSCAMLAGVDCITTRSIVSSTSHL